MIELSLEDITLQKQKIRKEMLAKRKAFLGEQRVAANDAIWHKFKVAFLDSKIKVLDIMFYYSFRLEVYTHGIIDELSMQGDNIFLPKMRKREVEGEDIGIAEYKPGQIMHPGRHRILEPNTPFLDGIHLDMIIVPGIAFDLWGNRLGRGKGYYDRFLAKEEYKRVTRIAPAYSFQVLDKPLPSLKHDQRVDFIITERGVINTR